MTTELFWVALALTVASFAAFVWGSWWAFKIAMKTASAAEAAAAAELARAQGMQLESAGVALPDTGKLAEAFAKAGTAAIAATLCVFFAFVAMLSSGLVELAVETKSDETASKTE